VLEGTGRRFLTVADEGGAASAAARELAA
jgi:hypothetical protein